VAKEKPVLSYIKYERDSLDRFPDYRRGVLQPLAYSGITKGLGLILLARGNKCGDLEAIVTRPDQELNLFELPPSKELKIVKREEKLPEYPLPRPNFGIITGEDSKENPIPAIGLPSGSGIGYGAIRSFIPSFPSFPKISLLPVSPFVVIQNYIRTQHPLGERLAIISATDENMDKIYGGFMYYAGRFATLVEIVPEKIEIKTVRVNDITLTRRYLVF
jgi:hypothetical protein